MHHFGHGPSPLNVPFPAVQSRFNDVDAMLRDVAAHADGLAAVIVEPMQGGAGAIAGAPAFLHALREETARRGVILIFDEVMSSRTHPGGMQARLGIRPDMVTLGKYVAGGLTIGAFGGRADIMSRFDPARPDAFPHGGTFNNNVLAMAAGHAALTGVLTDDASARMNARGDRLRDGLAALAARHRLPVVATGVGSVFGLHFSDGPVRSIEDLDRAEAGREAAIASLKKLYHLDMLAAGQYVSRRIMGCLSVETSEAEVDGFLGATEQFFLTRGELVREVFAGSMRA
jgi:glutamate-1-semialdehyde 2,1-aminomutase